MNNFSITEFLRKISGGDHKYANRLYRNFSGMPSVDQEYTGSTVNTAKHPLEIWAKSKGLM